MDELERQIQQQRAALDATEDWQPEPGWQALEERLSGAKAFNRRRQGRWLAAASLLLVFSFGAFLFTRSEPAPAAPTSLEGFSTELAAKELEYRKLISQKENKIQLEKLNDPSYGYFFSELAFLDSLQAGYLADLPRYGQNERLLNTLLQYYELKLQLLEQLENELEKQAYYGNSIPDQEI